MGQARIRGKLSNIEHKKQNGQNILKLLISTQRRLQ
ncbi:unnamed protein product [Paramecium octaurelia]|uniref:Uncharacterized protein n=1 Tax=Paramecium octaurelia TaxID=43137 RepID=A0A8S1UWJ2_PAROT|nr:unnamed protein product [Paramecium octaurelia]